MGSLDSTVAGSSSAAEVEKPISSPSRENRARLAGASAARDTLLVAQAFQWIGDLSSEAIPAWQIRRTLPLLSAALDGKRASAA